MAKAIIVPLKTFTSYITNSVSPNWRCQILLLFPPLHQLIFAEEEEEGRLHLATLSNFVLGCVNLCVAKFRFSGYQYVFHGSIIYIHIRDLFELVFSSMN